MKCIRCGKPAKIKRKIFLDGYPKEIGYCIECFREVLKYESVKYTRAGLHVLTTHMELVEESRFSEKRFVRSIDDVYSEQPLIVQLTLFNDGKKVPEKVQENTVEDIRERKIFLLNHRLQNAIRLEKYRTASKLKQELEKLKKSSKKN
uniref:UVR domain-containing protein n=1 Tax=Fervidobacterium thailandense TaxID=1008305 RepID=A0A7C5RKK8_9BACT